MFPSNRYTKPAQLAEQRSASDITPADAFVSSHRLNRGNHVCRRAEMDVAAALVCLVVEAIGSITHCCWLQIGRARVYHSSCCQALTRAKP